MSEESFVYTACPGWGDHEYCALKTVVKDGKIIRTEPADYTGCECKEGFICQKGVMSWRQVYNEKRLTVPPWHSPVTHKQSLARWDGACTGSRCLGCSQAMCPPPQSVSCWMYTSLRSSLACLGSICPSWAISFTYSSLRESAWAWTSSTAS